MPPNQHGYFQWAPLIIASPHSRRLKWRPPLSFASHSLHSYSQNLTLSSSSLPKSLSRLSSFSKALAILGFSARPRALAIKFRRVRSSDRYVGTDYRGTVPYSLHIFLISFICICIFFFPLSVGLQKQPHMDSLSSKGTQKLYCIMCLWMENFFFHIYS